jgi:hypothetical protein
MVKFSLSLINYALLHEDIWESGGIAPRFLNSALDGVWLVSRSGRFTPWERVAGSHWIGGWVGPRDGLGNGE